MGNSREATITVAASDALDPTAYDYACDGTADNVQIQAAIDALPSNGGLVVLSEGIFTVTAAIALGKNTILQGQGRVGTTIKKGANDIWVITVKAATGSFLHTTVKDMKLDGNGKTGTEGGILVQPTANGANEFLYQVYLHDLYVETMVSGPGIELDGISESVISSCFLNGSDVQLHMHSAAGTNSTTIIGNEFHSAAGNVTVIMGSSGENMANLNVIGNNFGGSPVVTALSYIGDGTSFINNYFEFIGSTPTNAFLLNGKTNIVQNMQFGGTAATTNGINIVGGTNTAGNLILNYAVTNPNVTNEIAIESLVTTTRIEGGRDGSGPLNSSHISDSGTGTVFNFSRNVTDPATGNAIAVTRSGVIPLVIASGNETRTLAAPTFIGQELILYLKTNSGTDVLITCATTINEQGGTTILFTATGQSIKLIAIEEGANLRWRTM